MLSMAQLGSSTLLKRVLECLDGQENTVGRTMGPWVDLVPKTELMWSIILSQKVAQLAGLSLRVGLSPKNGYCFLSDSIIFVFLHHQNSTAGL